MNKLIEYALNNGMIDVGELQSLLEKEMRDKILESHPYKIYQGKNGRWNTYLPLKDGRKKITRVKKEDVEKEIVNFYENQKDDPTVKELSSRWLDHKMERFEIELQSRQRYERVIECLDDDFLKMKCSEIRTDYLEDMIIKMINVRNMSHKQYSTVRTVLLGMFKYAKKKGYVSFSMRDVIEDADISNRMFRKPYVDDSKLVYSEEEKNKVENYIVNHCKNVKDLGILLLFKTGMRPGELSSLKWEDVSGNTINVKRTEVAIRGDGKVHRSVRDFPKTEAGIRSIIIPQSAMWIIEAIEKEKQDDEYVFFFKGKRLTNDKFTNRMRAICKNAGVPYRSLNKIRKTYATILIDSNVSDSVITSQMGHKSILTTKNFYYKNRKSQTEKQKIIDSVAEL